MDADIVMSPENDAGDVDCNVEEQHEVVLCARCRDHMQKHYHGELCGRCRAIFAINRPWSLPELNIHHGVAHGTSSAILRRKKSVLKEANQHKQQELLRMANAESDQCHQ